MRLFVFAFVLLTACQTALPQGPDADLSPMVTDEIMTTTLDGPAQEPTMTDLASPEPVGPQSDAPDAPQKPKSAEQTLCEKTGGQWSVAGQSGAYSCVKPTRDGGKLCTQQGDCQGMCLARSGTCAPFMPLFGCNEVLEKDGRRVTLCID